MRRLAARILLLDGWRRSGLAFLAGALLTFGLPPYNFPAVGFVGFPILVWLLDGAAGDPGRGFVRRLAPAFGIGWMFGFGYFVAGLWWLGAAMLVDAEGFLWAIPFAVLVLPAIVAVYFGLAAALAKAFWSDGGARILALAGSFALFEYLRGVLFTGFPWNEIGVMAAPVALAMQSASVVGVHGLTLAAVFVFAAPAVLADEGRRMPVLGLAACLILLHVGFGAWRLATNETHFVEDVRLRVVQPHIEQTLKWDEGEAERNFSRLVALVEDRPAAGPGEIQDAPATTLVVWPETAFPFILTERPDAIARLADALAPGETLIAGAVRVETGAGEQEPRIYNSIYVIDDNGEILDARDKTHLVPFGEYLPYESLLESFGIRQLAQMPGGFSPGALRTPVPLAGAPSFLPLVCYEIIFPGEIDAIGERPGFIVNVTNDAWYGHTPGPFQHLRQAELTAVAVGLPLVRSANTGVSVVTDAYGRLVEGLSLGSSGVIAAPLPAAADATIFARLGDIPFWLMFAAAWAVVAGSRTRRSAGID